MKMLVVLGAINGFLAVAFGAFGAHGLQKKLAGLEDFSKRLAWWETGAHYHLMHALAVFAAAWLLSQTKSPLASYAGYSFSAGIILFSGSLYAMTLSGVRILGAVTPIGGTLFLLGWGLLAIAGFRSL